MRNQLGLQPTDRFAVMSCNSHEYLELFHAGFLGGGIINPLNLRLAGKELQHILRDSGTTVAFVDAVFADHFARNIADVRSELALRHVVLIGDGDLPHDVRYEDLIEAGEPVVPSEPEETDPVVLMYTGGTTGLAKGVLFDQRAEMLNFYHIGLAVDFGEDRVYLHQTPMFHAASMGGISRDPGDGWLVGVRTAVRTGAGHGRHRALPRRLDRDGADDDRARDEPSRLPTRNASRRSAISSTARHRCRPHCSTG